MRFEIDRSKWRCGDFWYDSHGEGSTYLLNDSGYMCCLGMVSEQLGFSKHDMLNLATPSKLRKENILSEQDEFEYYHSTRLSEEAMRINDSQISREDREEKLVEVFKRYGHELVFINNYTEVTAYEEI